MGKRAGTPNGEGPSKKKQKKVDDTGLTVEEGRARAVAWAAQVLAPVNSPRKKAVVTTTTPKNTGASTSSSKKRKETPPLPPSPSPSASPSPPRTRPAGRKDAKKDASPARTAPSGGSIYERALAKERALAQQNESESSESEPEPEPSPPKVVKKAAVRVTAPVRPSPVPPAPVSVSEPVNSVYQRAKAKESANLQLPVSKKVTPVIQPVIHSPERQTQSVIPFMEKAKTAAKVTASAIFMMAVLMLTFNLASVDVVGGVGAFSLLAGLVVFFLLR